MREIWKVVPIDYMSDRDMEFARRQGIIVDPDFNRGGKGNDSGDNALQRNCSDGWLDLGSADVLPAGNIKSRFRRNVETRPRRTFYKQA